MTSVFIAVTAIICLLAGALILGTGIFFWYLLKVARSLNQVLSEFKTAIDPLIKSGSLQVMAGSASRLVVVGDQILLAMKNINTTVGLFNKAFFKTEALNQAASVTQDEPYAEKAESAVFSHDEGEAAVRERQGFLRKEGFETDEAYVFQPPASQMKGANV